MIPSYSYIIAQDARLKKGRTLAFPLLWYTLRLSRRPATTRRPAGSSTSWQLRQRSAHETTHSIALHSQFLSLPDGRRGLTNNFPGDQFQTFSAGTEATSVNCLPNLLIVCEEQTVRRISACICYNTIGCFSGQGRCNVVR